MRKLTALTTHLLAVTGMPRESIHAFADKGSLLPEGRDCGNWRERDDSPPVAQVEVGIWKYDGVINIERYPGDGLTLAAVVVGWLAEADGERDGLADPELNVELNAVEDTCDVEIAIEFEERLMVVEDAAGDIPFAGKRWRIRPVEIVPVTSLAGIHARKGGA